MLVVYGRRGHDSLGSSQRREEEEEEEDRDEEAEVENGGTCEKNITSSSNNDSGVQRSSVRCAGCGRDIYDRYYLFAVERQWHLECLTCCQCNEHLDTEISCFAREGHIYCRKDYHR